MKIQRWIDFMPRVTQSERIFGVKGWFKKKEKNRCHVSRLSMLICINSQALTAKMTVFALSDIHVWLRVTHDGFFISFFFFVLALTDLFASPSLRPRADATACRGSLGAQLPAGSRCDRSRCISSCALVQPCICLPAPAS